MKTLVKKSLLALYLARQYSHYKAVLPPLW